MRSDEQQMFHKWSSMKYRSVVRRKTLYVITTIGNFVCQMINNIIFRIVKCYFVALMGGTIPWNKIGCVLFYISCKKTNYHGNTWSSRPRELPPQPLTQPDVNLSIHPAPASPSLETSRSQTYAEINPAPPSCLVDLHLLRAGSSPSLQPHYRIFNTNTGWSAPVPRIGTLTLVGPPLAFLP